MLQRRRNFIAGFGYIFFIGPIHLTFKGHRTPFGKSFWLLVRSLWNFSWICEIEFKKNYSWQFFDFRPSFSFEKKNDFWKPEGFLNFEGRELFFLYKIIEAPQLFLKFWFLLLFSKFVEKSKILKRLAKIFTLPPKWDKKNWRKVGGSIDTVDYNAKEKKKNAALYL